MPLRSVKMKRFIFGFQRRVWCPKWTPLSRSWRIVTTAMVVLLLSAPSAGVPRPERSRFLAPAGRPARLVPAASPPAPLQGPDRAERPVDRDGLWAREVGQVALARLTGPHPTRCSD